MTTTYRPTARVSETPNSTFPAASSLAGLTTRARRLWARDLRIEDRERQDTLAELAELDLAIERLSMRAASGTFRVTDGALADRCRRRIEAFEAQWDAATATTALEEPSSASAAAR